MSDHKVLVYDLTGTKRYEFTDFLDLSVTREVPAPGFMAINLSGEHALLANLQDKWQFEYWRKPTGLSWSREFVGIYRKKEWEKIGVSTAVLSLPGLVSMLGWRHVAWYANTTWRSKFVGAKAETIMKYLVNYNAGASAIVANGRLREGAITGLSVQADGANGNTLDWFCAYDNLLSTLQDLAKGAGGDFDLVKTSSTTYEFRWYTGQLGTDRTGTVRFSMELGNMSNPKSIIDGMNSASVAIVGGKGENENRATTVVVGSDYHVTSNNIEIFVNASDVDTTNGLISRGGNGLAELTIKDEFTFNVVQTPASLYGVHYFLGDLVSGMNPSTSVLNSYKVASAVIAVSDNKDDIQVILKQV